jgi:hypothetical protein
MGGADGLPGLVSMRLFVPAIQYANVFEKCRDLGIIQIDERGLAGVR